MHRLTSDLKPGDKVLAPHEGVEEKQPATVIELPCPYCHEPLEYMDG